MLSGNEQLSSVSFSLQAIGAGALELLLGIAAAWLVAKMLRMRIGTGLRTFTLTAGVQNYAFFVIPIIQMLFTASNDPTLGILFVHNVGCELVVWSIGVIIIAGGPGNPEHGRLLPRSPAGCHRRPDTRMVPAWEPTSPRRP